MTIQEAIERLSKEKEQLSDAIECSLSGISERHDWGGLVQAIDTVLAELKESKKEGKNLKWKPTYGDNYWFRNVSGSFEVSNWEDDDIDAGRYKNIPLFITEEECKRYWHFMDTVKEKSYEFSDLDWRDDDIVKWVVEYDYLAKQLRVGDHHYIKHFGLVYFKDREDAQYIIDNFKEELMTYWL